MVRNRRLGWTLALIVLCTMARGQAVRHTGAWAIQQASTRRIDVVMIGDSNQLHFANGENRLYGGGWNGGWQYAFWKNAGLYATSLNPAGENNNNGATIGFFSSYLPATAPTSGAPAGANVYCPAGALPMWYYEYVAPGTGYYYVAGQSVAAGGPWNLQHLLRGWFATGDFATGAGLFRPNVRREDSLYNFYASTASAIPTNDGGGSGHVVLTGLDLNANTVASGSDVVIGWRPGYQGSGPTGPFIHYYTRVEDPAVTAGASVHTLIAAGGKGLYQFAQYLNAAPDLELWMIFNEARRLQVEQGLAPVVVMVINSGANDSNYTSAEVPSLGPTGGDGIGNSAASYIDNLSAVVNRIEGLYGKFWPISELSWVVMPTHPVSSPDIAPLLAYRAAVNSWAIRMPQASAVDLGKITSSAIMASNGWYFPDGTNYHLTQTGYDQLGLLAYQSLALAPPTLSARVLSVSAGQTDTLTVTPTGSGPFTYQWYQGASGNTSVPTGTNSATFITPPLSVTTSYWVRVTGQNGTFNSNSITILVTSVNAGSQNSADGPLPLWALGALGAGLMGLASRRRTSA